MDQIQLKMITDMKH